MGLREPSSKGWLSRTRPDARPASLPRGDGVKDMGKKVNEEAMLEQKAKEEALKKEALDFYRQLIERGFKPFDGASIDFHRKRDPVVFIPRENPILTAVKKEELPNFLKANNVNRVLVDALFPSRVPILQSLLEHDIEVHVLRRPSALAGFKAMLERRYNKKKNKQKQDGNNNDTNNGIKIPRKNDFVDAVALAFTWPKFHRKIEIPYLICWRAMNRWRRSYMLYYKVQQMLSEDEDELPVVTLHEDRLIKKAKMFVDTVEMHYPKIRQVFEEVRIPEDDVIAQALCSEIALETHHLKKFSRVLRKAGIGIHSVPKKKVRKKKEEVEKTEDKQTGNRPKRKVFQYDGKLLFAANQLAVKLFHLDPIKESEKVMLKTKKLLEEIWKRSRKLQMTEEYGRVGEALGCPAPLEKRGMKQL
jgi:uncharacterized protein YoxC